MIDTNKLVYFVFSMYVFIRVDRSIFKFLIGLLLQKCLDNGNETGT
jgi:hypothetical protein